MFIPVVGNFITLHTSGLKLEYNATDAVFLSVMGIAIAILGHVFPEQRIVRDSRGLRAASEPALKWSVAPFASGGAAGVGLTGSF